MAKSPDFPELTEKQAAFCREYCLDYNGTQAAIRAGYTEKSARSEASRMLTKRNIQSAIREMQQDLEYLSGITKLWVLEQYKNQATVSVPDVYEGWFDRKDLEGLPPEVSGCIKSVDTRSYKDEAGNSTEQVKLTFYDKQKALEAIRKMLGMDAPEKSIVQQSVEVVDFNKLLE